MKEKRSKARILLDSFSQQPLLEMANLRSKRTGLSDEKFIIYISTKQGSHGARIKVFKQPQLGDGAPCVIISISKEPKVIEERDLKLPKNIEKEVLYWVSINHIILTRLWNAKASHVIIDDYLEQLEKIKQF